MFCNADILNSEFYSQDSEPRHRVLLADNKQGYPFLESKGKEGLFLRV